MPQERLAHYTVLEKIGEGGMGVVYRAGDSKLGRDVALKVLPPSFVQDAERLARFRREAQVLAALNHPNIAAIYGLESDEERHALVLELVEGPTLEDRIEAGPVPLEEALPIARQITEALEAAHERGIVHRDLKPANVKLTSAGQVKVLDFGLAKALEPENAPGSAVSLSQSPTITAHLTGSNIILGTAAFMSPEQARGQVVDRRADVWAFGVILFEMLTGQRLFTGETVSDTLASVLKSEPEWERLPTDTPPAIRRLLHRCLRRNPRERLRDIGDARIVIDEVLRGESDPAAETGASAPAPRSRAFLAGAAAAVVILAGLAGVAAWTLKPSAPPPPLRKLEIPVDDASPDMFGVTSPAISPDGEQVVYATQGHLWVRDLRHLEPRQLPGTQDPVRPFWSPDGQWVAFFRGTKLMKTPVSGGEPSVVCDLGETGSSAGGGAWTGDGRIVFTTGDGPLLDVSAQGGDPRVLLPVAQDQGQSDFHQVSALPDGKGYLYAVHDTTGYQAISVFDGSESHEILRLPGQSLGNPVYSSSGYVLFQRLPGTAGIWAVPFSLAKLEVTGDPFLVAPGAGGPTVAADGTLVLAQGPSSLTGKITLLNRSGQAVETLGNEQEFYPSPVFSPDGRFVAARVSEADNRDIWLTDVERGTRTRLTFEEGSDEYPAWSQDGSRIYYVRGTSSTTFMIWMVPVDGRGSPVEITPGYMPSVSPDGKYLVYALFAEGDWQVYAAPLGPDGTLSGDPFPVVEGSGIQYWGEVSPDGRYLAYLSEESGRAEVYLTQFPSGRGKWQVSVNGGHWPCWTKGGRELLYCEGNKVLSVDVESDPTVRLGSPEVLFEHPPSGIGRPFEWPDGFDVTADGETFVMIQGVKSHEGQVVRPGLVVVQNWIAEFEN